MGKTFFRGLAAATALLAVLTATAGCARTRPGASHAPPAAATQAAGNPDAFTVYFLNVGKGDAALLQLPGGKWAMVDAGPPEGFAAVNGMLRLRGVKRLEAVFVSHPHDDHMGGLDGALAVAPCPAVYTTPADFGKPSEKLRETASAHGAAVEALSPGQAVEIAGVTFTAVGPNGDFADENDNSLTILARYGDFTVLFPGDQSLAAEAALLKSGRGIDCDVLKVAHHGQADASSDAFLRAASPAVAVVPAPASGSDAPPPDTLGRLKAAGASVYVVGQTGTLAVSSDGTEPRAVAPAAAPPSLQIREVNAKAEFVEIANPTDGAVDLTGWGLLSDKGNQFYAFPDGLTLPGGGTVRVYSGVNESSVPAGGLFWTEKKIWHDRKKDEAQLVDPYGRVADRQ